MYGSMPPMPTRATVGARRPTNDPHTAAPTGGRTTTSRSRAPRDPMARANYRGFNQPPDAHFVRAVGSVYDSVDLSSDYVDVWAEQEESYGEHAPFMDEWRNAIQRRGLYAPTTFASAAQHDPLADALFVAMGDGEQQDAPPPAQEVAPPTHPTTDVMETTSESDMGDDEGEDSSTSVSSASSTSAVRTVTPLITQHRTAANTVQFPAGGKNAKRRRERMTVRMQERADRLQQQCDETEREVMARATTTTSVATNVSTTTATTNTTQTPMKNFTSDHFFDALDAAVKHAQANSTATASDRSGDIQQLATARAAEPTPHVPTTAYMRQICGDLMTDIDPLVAYRMIFTVDYILSVHQIWSARMYMPVDARPRMPLKVAAALLRNDSLYIDRCAVLEIGVDSGEISAGEARTMVQFGCKFNNMLAEDQEEADRKRKPFRPFNEAELRADVDEYCVATSLWACDTPGRLDDCSNAMLSDSASAYEKSPMGDVLVYWHSFAFGFRAHGATQV